jgi:hypothetical protein
MENTKETDSSSKSPLAQTRTPQSILGNGGDLYNRGHFSLYGLGWFLEEYSGRKIQSHTGGCQWFCYQRYPPPGRKTRGYLFLPNTDANNFYQALKWEIMMLI